MATESVGVGRIGINALRDAVRQLLGAERRLRRRSQGPGHLSYAQVLTLAVLARDSGQTAAEVARGAGLDPGSLTAVLDQLESVGAIERSRNPANRRAYVITLTDHGHDLVTPSLTDWVSRWDQRLSRFSDEQLVVATEVVAAITDVFESVPRCGAQ